ARMHGQEALMDCEPELPEIIGVAIKHGDMVIGLPKPNRHHHVIKYMVKGLGITPPVGCKSQGFYDAKGKYYGREEARQHTMNSGQCESPDHHRELFSEDLW
ncbi:MAG: hypothetical protein KAS32_28030, partial [Candidatus Peribacteraceae bacterium]|nr:hypothetical protein [Candidatus Peribacteraceae bacterium]